MFSSDLQALGGSCLRLGNSLTRQANGPIAGRLPAAGGSQATGQREWNGNNATMFGFENPFGLPAYDMNAVRLRNADILLAEKRRGRPLVRGVGGRESASQRDVSSTRNNAELAPVTVDATDATTPKASRARRFMDNLLPAFSRAEPPAPATKSCSPNRYRPDTDNGTTAVSASGDRSRSDIKPQVASRSVFYSSGAAVGDAGGMPALSSDGSASNSVGSPMQIDDDDDVYGGDKTGLSELSALQQQQQHQTRAVVARSMADAVYSNVARLGCYNSGTRPNEAVAAVSHFTTNSVTGGLASTDANDLFSSPRSYSAPGTKELDLSYLKPGDEHRPLWPLNSFFKCASCKMFGHARDGAVLRNCRRHRICMACLVQAATFGGNVKPVFCPASGCQAQLTDGELTAVLEHESEKTGVYSDSIPSRREPPKNEQATDTLFGGCRSETMRGREEVSQTSKNSGLEYIVHLGFYDDPIWPSEPHMCICNACHKCIAPLEGFRLKNCLIHTLCKECMKKAVLKRTCPICDETIYQREIDAFEQLVGLMPYKKDFPKDDDDGFTLVTRGAKASKGKNTPKAEKWKRK